MHTNENLIAEIYMNVHPDRGRLETHIYSPEGQQLKSLMTHANMLKLLDNVYKWIFLLWINDSNSYSFSHENLYSSNNPEMLEIVLAGIWQWNGKQTMMIEQVNNKRKLTQWNYMSTGKCISKKSCESHAQSGGSFQIITC